MLQNIERVLKIILVSLLIIILIGTIYGLLGPGINTDSRRITDIANENWGHNTFTDIGQLRITTADPQPEGLIIYVTFTYYPSDRAFTEELYLRTVNFREIIISYIGSFTMNDLRGLNEDTIKNELLRQFNAILRLGQIESLFFSEFMPF